MHPPVVGDPLSSILLTQRLELSKSMNMMLKNLMGQKTKRRKLILSALAILALVSLCFVAFHHHDAQNRHADDCSVCLAVHTLAYVSLFYAALALGSLPPRISFKRFSQGFISRLEGPVLRDRAPPKIA